MFKFLKTMAIAALLLVSPVLWADALDINVATADELAKGLSGIGPAKAQAIVQYREKNGPFKSVDDLTHVKGIGKATLEKNRAKVSVAGSAPTPVAAPAAAPIPAAPAAVPPPAATPGAPPAAHH